MRLSENGMKLLVLWSLLCRFLLLVTVLYLSVSVLRAQLPMVSKPERIHVR